MKFTNLVAMVAIVSLASTAYAQNDGTLRRSTTVAQNDTNVVIIPQAAQAQPTTVVEAAPVSDSKAEVLRKARQNQEVQTEQKIVEKLEESRLKEEQQRAERLFGDKLNDQVAPAPAPAPAPVPVAAPAPAPAPVVAPVVETKPQQVTIEKIEIVQPTIEKEEKPVEAKSVADLKEEKPQVEERKYFVGANLALPQYAAGNMKTNYGLGLTVGSNIDPNWVIEGSLLYSNYNIDTFWVAPLYSELNQYDIQAVAKYNIMTGNLKPYVGAGAAYVYRSYTTKIANNSYNYNYQYQYGSNYNSNNLPGSVDTQTVNLVILAGVTFNLNQKVSLDAGLDYNKPMMAQNSPRWANYGLPDNTKRVEDFDYYTFKVGAKFNF